MSKVRSSIDIDRLAAEIAEGLATYKQGVVEGVNEVSAKVSKEAVKKLKATSPELTKSYKKGWRIKHDKMTGQVDDRIIHNATDYQLTHLLEHGHAKVGGGRAEAIPHIRPVEEELVKGFTEGAEEAIKNG